MSKKILIFAGFTLLFGVFIGSLMNFDFNKLKTRELYAEKNYNLEKDSDVELLQKISRGYEKIAKTVKPSVVTITSEKTLKIKSADPFEEFFFGMPFGRNNHGRNLKQRALGSGVIISEDGYILTNNHVVEGADELKIKLSDGTEYKGKIIGTDSKTDLGLIKIDAKDLIPVKIGDSGQLEVGQWVLAVGSPFELNQTVTTGIISALKRNNLNLTEYEDFIQTDAAINPGNSGGPLLNLKGELIGINTAIVSKSGGNQGIGFAIPVNLAMKIYEELKENKKVVRGWLGVGIEELTVQKAEVFGLKDNKGVLVSNIFEKSPAALGGLETGDIILEVDGEKTSDPSSLKNIIAFKEPGTKIKLKIWRKGAEKNITVEIGERDSDGQYYLSGSYYDAKLGLKLREIDNDIAEKFRLDENTEGVIITSIDENGDLSNSPLKAGDVISQVIYKGRRYDINNIDDYMNIRKDIKEGNTFGLYIKRGHSGFFVTLQLPEN